MACNCGGGSPSLHAGSVTGPGSGQAGGWTVGRGNAVEYEVTFPDGTVRVFTSDTEAYRQVRIKGGGIRPRPRAGG